MNEWAKFGVAGASKMALNNSEYSSVPNRRAGPNKRAGGKIIEKE